MEENLLKTPALRLIEAHRRLKLAVFATVTGPLGDVPYGGSSLEKKHYDDLITAARELADASDAWEAERKAYRDRDRVPWQSQDLPC